MDFVLATYLHHSNKQEEYVGISAELFEEKLRQECPQIVLGSAAKCTRRKCKYGLTVSISYQLVLTCACSR